MDSSTIKDFAEFKDTVFHFSIASALINKLPDGACGIGEIKKYGNFGLYTYNALDGEGIILDNHFYKIKGDGKVYNTKEVDLKPSDIIISFSADNEINFKHNFHVMLERSSEFYNFEVAESTKELLNKIEKS